MSAPPRAWQLLDATGQPYASATPGTLGGHRRLRIYGRLDCPSALRHIANGHYVTQRVFFADEATASAAGYRPCARCLPERYAAWKADTDGFKHCVGGQLVSEATPRRAETETLTAPASVPQR